MPAPPGSTPSDRVPVVLDTDIGTDVDDLLALLLLGDEPSVELQAVTTVYGDVRLRAQLAARVLRLLGQGGVPVHAGQATPQSGREVWWPGHEGGDIDGLDTEPVHHTGGVDALLEASERHAGELVVVAIGPLTNLGAALDRDPRFADRVARFVIMGGEFAEGRPEHNLRSDVVAAGKVLSCGAPAVFVGLDVTTTVWFGPADLEAATASGTELAQLLDGQVRDFWRFAGQLRNHPHDPLAVLAMTEPELFSFARGGWRVVDDEDRLGALVADTAAPHVDRAVSVEVDAARRSITRRLTDAVGAGRR